MVRKIELLQDHLNKDAVGRRKCISFLSLTSVVLIAWLYLIYEYRKWDAQWGCFNILVVSILVAIAQVWWISRRRWVSDLNSPTQWRFMIIPMVGFVLCASLGIYFTEPMEAGGSVTRYDNRSSTDEPTLVVDRRSPDYQYDYSGSRASRFYLLSSAWDLVEGVGYVGEDLDEAGLFILLVIIVIVLIFGSFLIPHFWTLATFMILVMMAIVTYKEWRLFKCQKQ